MANVLEQIVIDKKEEIAQRKLQLPLSEFKGQLKPSKKDFYGALAAPNASYILECKKASPSKGLIRAHFDLDEIIEAYAPHASCISVLTDEKYFQGKFEYLDYITERVTQPVINKDFFVDPYQIYLARYHNADAVLLMLSVLDDTQYKALADIAQSLALDVLTEVSNEEEVTRALALNARIIGINNRNLRDLSTDLATTERLVPMITDTGFDGVIISESGIYTHQEIRRLSPLVDAFLVGSALMAQDDLPAAINKLVYGEVKICGVTTPEQAQMLSAFPVSFLGLIFVEQSPRFVEPETAFTISQAVDTPLVGVFQNHALSTITQEADELGLKAVQLHGEETEEFVHTLRETLADHIEIWKVISVEHASDVSAIGNQYPDADRILVDTKVGLQTGGTGQAFDWRWLQGLPANRDFVLAGGITPHNANAARQTLVKTIDVNSGVESAKGIKDEALVKALFKELRKY